MEGEKQHQIVSLFRQIDRSLKRAISRKVMDTGIYRSQHALLMMLGKFPECSQAELAEKMDISPAAIAVSLKKLEKAGYVSRQCKQHDNRMNQVIITDKGRAAIDVSIHYFKEMEAAILKDFSMQEMEMLEDFFKRIIKNEEDYYESLLKQDKKI